MPSFFSEGNTPKVQDTRWRALEKILGATIGGGTGVGFLTINSGNPEGVVTAAVGARVWDDVGGAFYTKVSGVGNTGWQAE